MIKHSSPSRYLSKGKNTRSEESQQIDPRPEYSRSIYFLFLAFALYITMPIIDIPLLGLSISAPIFFLIALPVLLKPPKPWFGIYRNWIILAVFIWTGIFFSATLNGLFSGGAQFDRDGLISIIQFAYWFLVFVVTIYLVSSQKNLVERLMGVIAIGTAFLGILRLGEAIFGGATGAWTSLRIMSQNSYGLQFSMFYPILLSYVFWGEKRKLAISATFLLVIAILINGSRTGWLATLISTIIFLWMYLRTQRKYVRTVVALFFLAGMLGVGVLFAPQVVITAFEQRFSTFQSLEEDKSYAIRQLMVKKGVLLFQSSPLIGVGVSRWIKESLPLELPSILRYAPQVHFDHKSSHNSYVSFLAETGLVGALPLGVLVLILLTRGYIAAVHLSKRGQTWALGIYASFIGMSIHLWALSGLTGTSTWFIYGLVAAMIMLDKQFNDNNTEKASNASRLSLSYPRHF